MTHADVGPAAVVSLREITAETVGVVCKLSDTLFEHQKRMVAANAVSIAEAHFEPKAWFRAIYADETPVGFVMLYDDPEKPDCYLWRFMIGGPHQKKGFGRQAMNLILERARSRPSAVEVTLSYVPIEGNPEPFYRCMGFEPTGKVEGGEIVMRRAL
ncbi:MAG: GNAT family N-acetyltransferase [Candidatus Bipolaricaulis sp.]|nr:GNAT family N-acetyltransferase [Candidatus Bipolaricaulis sp.]